MREGSPDAFGDRAREAELVRIRPRRVDVTLPPSTVVAAQKLPIVLFVSVSALAVFRADFIIADSRRSDRP